jgi:hypothetical protein
LLFSLPVAENFVPLPAHKAAARLMAHSAFAFERAAVMDEKNNFYVGKLRKQQTNR